MYMKKKVGTVTEDEKKEIRSLFERKNGLAELAKIVKDDDTLYEKLVKDMGTTTTRFQQWWDNTATKHQWESAEDGNWEIDFETNEIFLTYR
jgi:CXXX repeat modification system protein